jgi:hypothetical protein
MCQEYYIESYTQTIATMEDYVARHIQYREVIALDDWKVKVYTISKDDKFSQELVYEHVLEQLPAWLERKNSFNSNHYGHAFLILHVASEGVFSLINWWLEGYMLNMHVFLSNPEDPTSIKQISGDGLGPCTWELEVINHERVAWTKHVLKKGENPDFEAYLSDTTSIRM